MDRISKLQGTYTLRVEHGSLRTSMLFDEKDIDGAKERVDGQAGLILPIAKDLEDFTAVYWVHDTPSGLISYNHRKELLNYLDEEECESSQVEIRFCCESPEKRCDGRFRSSPVASIAEEDPRLRRERGDRFEPSGLEGYVPSRLPHGAGARKHSGCI